MTIERYYSYAVQELLDDESQLDFASEMLDNGRYRFALLTVPDLPDNARVMEIKLRCAFQLKWWRTLESTLQQNGDPEVTLFWMGMKALHDGQYKIAYESLQSSGEQGAAFLRHWELGHELFGRLKSKQDSKRLSAITDWENWQSSFPGPKIWTPDPTTIASCAGAATIYSETRDLRAQFFRSTPARPAKVQIHGPIRIRIEGRPIHASSDGQPLRDVITVTSGDQIERVPVSYTHLTLPTIYSV